MQAELVDIVASASRDEDLLTIINRPDGFKPAGTPGAHFAARSAR